MDDQRVNRDLLNQLSADRIERVEVLKGAAAVEYYGEDGRNGVINIKLNFTLILFLLILGTLPTLPSQLNGISKGVLNQKQHFDFRSGSARRDDEGVRNGDAACHARRENDINQWVHKRHR